MYSIYYLNYYIESICCQLSSLLQLPSYGLKLEINNYLPLLVFCIHKKFLCFKNILFIYIKFINIFIHLSV